MIDAPTSPAGILLPVTQMDDAPWNILDASGERVMIAGSIDGDKWTFHPELAKRVVKLLNKEATPPADGQAQPDNEVQEIITCLEDDAATLRNTNPDDEMAANMDTAAKLLRQQDADKVDAQRQLVRRMKSLEDALHIALPFVEDAEVDDGYKPGFIAKQLKVIRTVLLEQS